MSWDGLSGNRTGVLPNTSIFPSQHHSTSAPCSPSSKLDLTEGQACMGLLKQPKQPCIMRFEVLNYAAEDSILLR